jgi:hypothetical protein
MLSTWEYLHACKLCNEFEAWRNGRASYSTNSVPPELQACDNDLRSAVEVYEFCTDPPSNYMLYVNEARREATTWTGEKLGRVTFGREFRDNFGGKRVPVWIDAINGRTYHGTYYKSAGDYARVKLTKRKRQLSSKGKLVSNGELECEA